MVGDVPNDQRGGYLRLTTGTVWAAELVNAGQVEGLERFQEADQELWLHVTLEASCDAYATTWRTSPADPTDEGVRGDLPAVLEGECALPTLSLDVLNRHVTYPVHGQVWLHRSALPPARARLADPVWFVL